LTSRSIDLEFANVEKDEQAMTKVGKREDIIQMLLRYLDTDTLLVFSPEKEYEGGLRKAQEELYRPVIANVENLLQSPLSYLDSDRDGLRGNRQSEETREKARQWINQLSYWELVALEKTTLTTKSLICGILLICSKTSKGLQHQDLQLTLEEIAHLASLEIVYQTERWGEVEDTHDVDFQDLRRNINSAALLCFEERE
jgi:ATP synthase F1 complex assembly factor 2